jgi:hypothetical protein
MSPLGAHKFIIIIIIIIIGLPKWRIIGDCLINTVGSIRVTVVPVILRSTLYVCVKCT